MKLGDKSYVIINSTWKWYTYHCETSCETLKQKYIWFMKLLNSKHKIDLKVIFLWWKTTTKDSTKYKNHVTYNFKDVFNNMIYLDIPIWVLLGLNQGDASKTINHFKTYAC